MQLDSEQVVLEEHPIRFNVSEAPRPTITYSRTVSKNVILVLEFEQMYIEFLKVGKLTYKICFFLQSPLMRPIALVQRWGSAVSSQKRKLHFSEDSGSGIKRGDN